MILLIKMIRYDTEKQESILAEISRVNADVTAYVMNTKTEVG